MNRMVRISFFIMVLGGAIYLLYLPLNIFTDWIVIYFFLTPLFFSLIAKEAFKILFFNNEKSQKVFWISLIASYLILVGFYIYAITHIQFGNSWI